MASMHRSQCLNCRSLLHGSLLKVVEAGDHRPVVAHTSERICSLVWPKVLCCRQLFKTGLKCGDGA